MNRVITSIIFASAGVVCASASGPIDIDELVDKIVANNGIHDAQVAANAAQIQAIKTENNLSDPEVEFTHLWGQKGIGNKYDIGISQRFDWPGVYSARNKAAQSTARALDYLALQNVSDLRLRVKQTMIDAISARKKIDLYGEVLVTIDSLSRIVERNVKNREVSILDANRLKIERIAFASKYDEATMAYDEACSTLTGLNGGIQCPEILLQLTEYPGQTILRPLQAYQAESDRLNPQKNYQSSMYNAYMDQAKAIRRGSLPGFSIGYNHEYEMGERFNGFSVSMTLPFLSNKGKSKARELETKAFTLQSVQNDIATYSRIAVDYSKASLLSKQIGDYSEIFDEQNHIQLLNKAFEARQLTILSYLTDLIYFTEAKSNYLDLEYEYQLLMASLDRFAWLNGR